MGPKAVLDEVANLLCRESKVNFFGCPTPDLVTVMGFIKILKVNRYTEEHLPVQRSY